MNDKKNDFWERVKTILNRKNISESEFARMANVSSANLAMWKKGSMPTALITVRVAQILDTTAEYLIMGVSREESESSKISLIKSKLNEIFAIINQN